MDLADDLQSLKAGRQAEVSLPFPEDLTEWAFFLDVDGTLLDIASSPDAIVIPPDLGDLLTRLNDATGGAVALVTGREIDIIDRFFAPLKLPVAGVHGAELRLPDGSRRSVPVHPDLARIIAELQSFAAANEGLIVEPKGRAVAVHYRLNPALGEDVESFVRDVVESGAPGLEIQPGKMVVEVRPAKVDKGRAIGVFMEHDPYAGRSPLAMGDDWTDEPAFRTVNARGGRSIRVGVDKRPTEANEGLADPASVRAWLAALVEGQR